MPIRPIRSLKKRLSAARQKVNRICHGASEPAALLAHLRSTGGLRVLSGPFAGLRYIDQSHGSTHLPKLLGTYELELHPWLSPQRLGGHDTVVNLGCGEGYYLAGLAQLFKQFGYPQPRLIGLDLDPLALDASRRLLELNGLPPADLRADGFERDAASAEIRALIFCDVEGAEEQLLDMSRVPALATATMVVEVHDEPGDTRRLALLCDRFQQTHNIEQVDARPRDANDFPPFPGLRIATSAKVQFMNEQRMYGNRWLCLTPHH